MTHEPTVHVAAFLNQFCDGKTTHSYASVSVCANMAGPGLSIELHVPAAVRGGRREFVRAAIPAWLCSGYYRADREGRFAERLCTRNFRAALRRADVAYLWASTPESVYRDVKAAGVPLVVERVNCHRATSIPILEEAYRRAGIPAAHGITASSLEEERRKLAMADWIFAPSPLVRQSLLDEGIADERILPISYGWSQERMGDTPRRVGALPVFLFVGSVCVRKGAHLLVEAWTEAEVQGRLDICGPILPEIRAIVGSKLGHPGIRTPGSVWPISRATAEAEVFAFPTLEEGSSLAVLEAMASGLALLTSPMGAGDIVRHGQDGFVLDPYDRPAWVSALRQLASDPALRARMGASARARAQEFTWPRAGANRRTRLLEAFRAARLPDRRRAR